jgi:hypothetical protein
VSADLHLDPDSNDLTNICRSEIVTLRAMRTRSSYLAEEAKGRDAEADALREHQPSVPEVEAGSLTSDDPPVFESARANNLAIHPVDLCEKELIALVREAYKTDDFFSKILKNPESHSAFVVRDGLIHGTNLAQKEVLCVPELARGEQTLRLEILDAAHLVVGHLGAQKTMDYVRRWYWWSRIARDVDKYCLSCHVCQTTKPTNQKPAGKLHGLPVPSAPWQSIAMDFLGPFPLSEGYDYLWVVIDRFSGLMHLIPITTRT